jgi:acetyl-CoA acetyltransferase
VARKFEARCKVAIAGYAQSPAHRHTSIPLGTLAMNTCLEAIADAGVKKDDIDGFSTAPLFPSLSGRTPVDGVDMITSGWIASQLGIHARYLVDFGGAGQLPGSVVTAVNAIASGAADYVLLHRALANPPGKYHDNPMTEARGNAQWMAPQGFWGPPVQVAMTYMEYMQRYGATREDMARVVVELRRQAARIPTAYWYQKPLSVDEYMNARMISDPISVLDCDIPITGVAAFVLTSAERARDLPNKPVFVAGYALGNLAEAGTLWSLEHAQQAGARTRRDLKERSGLGPADFDLAQLYDGFAPLTYIWLEALGYCGHGEAHRFVREQQDLARFFSGGGSLGNGRMHGVPPMRECYLQLSGRAGERQRPNARAGLACHSHPHLGGVVAYTAEPL